MYVTIATPEIAEYPQGFPQHWLKSLFIGSVSTDYQVNALASTYIRLVDAAFVEYRLGVPRLKEFWGTHTSINLPAMHRAISHFENCLTDMHRAITCFVRLRRHKELPTALRAILNSEKPEFVADRISDRLREIRNAIHHLEERVMNGDIQQGEPYLLAIDGPITPHDTELDQTIKTIDRLKIGSHEILFSDLAVWLREMGRFADKIACYEIPERRT